MAQVVNAELVRNLRAFFRGIDDSPILRISTNNVSNPPTAAEITAAFDSPANLSDGWAGIIDDNNAVTTVWLVTVVSGSWFYELLIKAV